MDLIQEVGSYAGFAAVVGLAVLAALFFSQARDLRRLREWAGRAPERAAGQTAAPFIAPEQAAQEAARPAASGAVRPIPAAKPAPGAAPAAAAQTGAAPATAVQPPGAKPATPAATPGKAPALPAMPGKAPAKPGGAPVPATAAAAATKTAPGEAATAPAGAPAKPGDAAKPDAKPGEAQPATAGPPPATPAGAPAQQRPPAAAPPTTAPPLPAVGAGATPPTGTPAPARPPVLPARPGPAPVGRTPAPGSQSTAVLPASSRLRERAGSGRRGGFPARYIALIVAGVIVVGAGLAFGVSQLGEDDEPATRSERTDEPQPDAGPINRSLVTVSVLNGTTVPGLAAQIGDEIESKGFQRGNVANAIDQQRPTSVVMFSEGAERPARIVARGLGIAQVEPVDPDSQALAGNASVIVIVGEDQTS